jgi:hypothetical protein
MPRPTLIPDAELEREEDEYNIHAYARAGALNNNRVLYTAGAVGVGAADVN